MKRKYSDRFSEAEKELPEKSPFVCESCETSDRREEELKKGENQGRSDIDRFV